MEENIFANIDWWKKLYEDKTNHKINLHQFGAYGEEYVEYILRKTPYYSSRNLTRFSNEENNKTKPDLKYIGENGYHKFLEVKLLGNNYQASCLDPYNVKRNSNGKYQFRPSTLYLTQKRDRQGKQYYSPCYSLEYADQYGPDNIDLIIAQPVFNDKLVNKLYRISGKRLAEMKKLSDNVYKIIKPYLDTGRNVDFAKIIPRQYTSQANNDVYISNAKNTLYMAFNIDIDGVDVLWDNAWIPGKTYMKFLENPKIQI